MPRFTLGDFYLVGVGVAKVSEFKKQTKLPECCNMQQKL